MNVKKKSFTLENSVYMESLITGCTFIDELKIQNSTSTVTCTTKNIN